MKFKKILSFILIAATMLTIFVIPASAEGNTLVNNSTISNNSILINDRIILNAAASGGATPYSYAYSYKQTNETDWHTIKDFSKESSVFLSLHDVDTYDVCIQVKDDENTIVPKYFEVTVSNGALSSSSYLSTDHVFLGKNVMINGVGVGGTGPYTYAFYYKRSIEETWHCLQSFQSNSRTVFTPEFSGTYDICIKVHDSLNAEHKLYSQLTVETPPFEATFTMNRNNIWVGESVNLRASVEGNQTYSYAFYARHSSRDNWSCLNTFSASQEYTFAPQQVGVYEVCIKAMNMNNVIAKQYFLLTVHNELNADNCYIADDQITIGEDIVMVGRGRGGVGPYQYAFYYKRHNNEEWSCARTFGSNGIATFTPQTTTNYDICIKVKDADNTIKKKYFTATVAPGFYVHYYNYNNWNDVKIYYTDGQNALVQWPGVNMTPEGDGWYSYKIINQENVIVMFSDGGNNQIPATIEQGLEIDTDIWYKNGILCDSTTDTDGDSLLDYQELIMSTNINLTDTDGDSLSDGYEVLTLNTNPLQTDSDNNNILDCNEDFDSDGLTNLQEYQNATDPHLEDTDNDGLSDISELNIYHTYPTDEDSDDDGATDGWEIEHEYDPNIPNNNFSVSLHSNAQNSVNELTTTLNGVAAAAIDMQFVEYNSLINSTIPGYIGQAIELHSDRNVQGTTLSFTFDSNLVNNNFNPKIYYLNEETQMLEEMPTQRDSNTVVSTTLQHCSLYVVLDYYLFREYYDNFNSTLQQLWMNTAKPINMNTMHVALVTDCSNNASSTTINNTKNLLQSIVSKLDSTHLATLIDSNNTMGIFTQNASDFSNRINNIANSNIPLYEGIEIALNRFDDFPMAYTDVLVILATDNLSSNVNYDYYYDSLINEIQNKDITIVMVSMTNNSINILQNIEDHCISNIWFNEIFDSSMTITQINDNVHYTKAYIDGLLLKDTNHDKILDRYTNRFDTTNNNRKITYVTGSNILVDPVIGNITSEFFNDQEEDYDDDGLLNGDEITLYKNSDGIIKAIRNTEPLSADVDHDNLLDSEDPYPFKYNTWVYYDRNAALNYAEQYANGQNPEYFDYSPQDCANFVSQCLHAGSVPMTLEWYFYFICNPYKIQSVSWTGAPEHYQYFLNNRNMSNGEIIEFTSQTEMETALRNHTYNIEPGDIMYLNSFYPEIDKQGHTTIISHVVSDNFENTIRYCAHSGQANDKSISETFWAGSPNGKIYIVHMRDKIITG